MVNVVFSGQHFKVVNKVPDLSLCKRKQYVPSALSISSLMLSPMYLQVDMSINWHSIAFLWFTIHNQTLQTLFSSKLTCLASQRKSWFLLLLVASSFLLQWSAKNLRLISNNCSSVFALETVNSAIQPSLGAESIIQFILLVHFPESWTVYHTA